MRVVQSLSCNCCEEDDSRVAPAETKTKKYGVWLSGELLSPDPMASAKKFKSEISDDIYKNRVNEYAAKNT